MRAIVALSISLVACREARVANDRATPPSGLYSVTEVMVIDSCKRESQRVNRHVVLVTASTTTDGSFHATVPLALEGPDLLSNITLDERRSVLLADSPSPSCHAAKRLREIALGGIGHDGFEVAIDERWELPAGHDECMLPPLPTRSCEKTRKLVLHLERSCPKPCSVRGFDI